MNCLTRHSYRFLWAHLQIEAICLEKTDQSIKEALVALPRSLPEVFQRILARSREFAPKYQVCTLQILAVAERPLSYNEFSEAINIIPGNTNITQSQVVNDVQAVLASCGSLVMLDEEQTTLHFAHHSVKRFVMGQLQENHLLKKGDDAFTEHQAQIQMGQIVVTYLSWDVFESHVSKNVVPRIAVGSMPRQVLESISVGPRKVQLMAMELLQRKTSPVNLDIGGTLATHSGKFSSPSVSQFDFLKYARDYWLHHTKVIHETSPEIFLLFVRLVSRRDLVESAVLWKDQPLKPASRRETYKWAKRHFHIAILEAYRKHAMDAMLENERTWVRFLEGLCYPKFTKQ